MAEDKKLDVEGTISHLSQTNTPKGIETTISLDPESQRFQGVPCQVSAIVFAGPTGLRAGDYISASGHGNVKSGWVTSGERQIVYAKRIYHLKSKGNNQIVESYEIGL